MSVWCVKGLPDDHLVHLWVNAEGRMDFGTGGSMNVAQSLNERLPVREIILPRPSINGRPSLIVNEISSPETHVRALRACAILVEKFGCPVINPPAAVMGTARDKVSQKLAGIPGLRVPRTIVCRPTSPTDVLETAQRNGFDMPFLIRETGSHMGKTLLRIENGDEAGQLHRLAYDGRPFYLTEYVDFRSPDGLYRKYRVMVVDGEAYLRNVVISSRWMIHAAQRPEMKQHADRMDEERFELQNFSRELRPIVQPIAAAAHRALQMDYFGIDCHLDRNGDALLFEANANMDIIKTGRAEMAPYVSQPFDALARLIRQRLTPSPR